MNWEENLDTKILCHKDVVIKTLFDDGGGESIMEKIESVS